MSQIIRKENPRKSPRAPPNSEIKDSIGYIQTSFFLVTVFDAIPIETLVSFLPKMSRVERNYFFLDLLDICVYVPIIGWRHFISKGIFHVGAWNLATCFINQILYGKWCQVRRYVSVDPQILNISACRKCTFICKCRVPGMKTADLISYKVLKLYHH